MTQICPTCDAGDPTSVVPFADCECKPEPEKAPRPGIILDRAALGAVAFSGAYGRPNTDGIHVKADGTVRATNGHYLAQIPPCAMPAEDFPEVAGMATNPVPDAGITIPADAVKATLKSLPKGGIPILTAAHFGMNCQGAVLTTTDLETAIPRAVKPLPGAFPDVERIISTAESMPVKVGLSPQYLKDIATYALAQGAKTVELSLKPEDEGGAVEHPVRFEFTIRAGGQKALIVLMPMRIK